MACTQHDLPDNIQDGLDIKSCYKCDGKGYTTIGFMETAKSQHLLEFSRANKAKANLCKFCEPCNGSGLGEKVKKVWYEDCHKCEGGVGLHGVQKTKYVGLVAVQKNVLLKLLLRLVQKDELQHK